MSNVVWEEPPGASRIGYTREKSPLRKEMELMLDEMRQHPDQWARLWDFPEKEDAEKRTMALRSVSGKGWAIAVRESQFGWSVYAKKKSDPDPVPQPQEPDPQPEATFQQ